MIAPKVLSKEELAGIERGLNERLVATPSNEALIDLTDFSTRKLRRLLEAYKTLQSRVQS
jgi:hypothetical protein